jgi:hypothetical protein
MIYLRIWVLTLMGMWVLTHSMTEVGVNMMCGQTGDVSVNSPAEKVGVNKPHRDQRKGDRHRPRKGDRHSPGYMAEYMRKRRASQKSS